MTAQAPDKITNHFPNVDFGTLQLYCIYRDAPDANFRANIRYAFKAVPRPPAGGNATSLHRGYIAHYLLDTEGKLTLKRFEYPYAPVLMSEPVNEVLHGEFWLMMARDFFGDYTFIPFVDGKIIAVQSRWVIENTGRTRRSWLSDITKRTLETHTAEVTIRVNTAPHVTTTDLKIYIDGNIISSGHNQSVSASTKVCLIRLVPGRHRIVIREADPRKPARKESNTVFFSIQNNQSCEFTIGVRGEELVLISDSPATPS